MIFRFQFITRSQSKLDPQACSLCVYFFFAFFCPKVAVQLFLKLFLFHLLYFIRKVFIRFPPIFLNVLSVPGVGSIVNSGLCSPLARPRGEPLPAGARQRRQGPVPLPALVDGQGPMPSSHHSLHPFAHRFRFSFTPIFTAFSPRFLGAVRVPIFLFSPCFSFSSPFFLRF